MNGERTPTRNTIMRYRERVQDNPDLFNRGYIPKKKMNPTIRTTGR